MPRKKRTTAKRTRRVFDKVFRQEAVQMLLDGHSARSVADRLGLSHTSLLYRWKKDCLDAAGPVANELDARVHELELELRRVERERDVLKKALAIFGRTE